MGRPMNIALATLTHKCLDFLKKYSLISLFIVFIFSSCKTAKNDTNTIDSETAHLSFKDKKVFEKYFYQGITEKMLGNNATAKEAFYESLNTNDRCKTCYYHLASIFHQENEYLTALGYAQKCNNLNKDKNFWFRGQLAQLYSLNGRNLESAKEFEKIIKDFPNHERSYFEAVSEYVKINEWNAALNVLLSHEKNIGISELSAKQMEHLYLKLNKPEKALDVIIRLNKTYSNNAGYQILWIEALLRMNRKDDAKALLFSVKNNSQLDGNALIKLGEISFKEQNYDEAFDYHLKAFSYNDIDFKTKLFWMSEYVRKFNYENNQVIQLSEELESNHPNEEMILILRADISNKTGKFKQSRDYYQKAALVNPSDFRTWKKILELNTKLNLKEDQLETTLKLLELFPNMTTVYIYRAQVLLDHNLADQAKKLAKEGLRIAIENDDQNQLNLILAHSLIKLNETIQAFEILNNLEKNNPKDDKILASYANILLENNLNIKKAKELIDLAIRIHPEKTQYYDIKNKIDALISP